MCLRPHADACHIRSLASSDRHVEAHFWTSLDPLFGARLSGTWDRAISVHCKTRDELSFPSETSQTGSSSSSSEQSSRPAISAREREISKLLFRRQEASRKMDADAIGTSKRGRPGHRPKEPQKLKFKPKVPPQKPKKSTAQKQQPEEPKPVDKELMKRLRTGRRATKTAPDIKDEHSTQDTPSMLSSVARVSIPLPQSGGHKQDQPLSSLIISQKTLQIPRVFSTAPIPGMFYDDEDDDDDDDDSVELQENLPSSAECESSIQPAKELNLLEQDEKTRMFLFQFPKSLPLPRMPPPTTVQRKGKAVGKEVKEGYNLNDLPGGYMGKMLVYKSGKIKMKLGDAVFDVNPGTECGMAQHAVAMNTREKHCCLLGEIENKHVVVTPEIDSLLNDNRP